MIDDRDRDDLSSFILGLAAIVVLMVAAAGVLGAILWLGTLHWALAVGPLAYGAYRAVRWALVQGPPS